MKPMELAPFLGSNYNIYFPIVLILLCAVNLFNLYTKFITSCCFKRFQRFVFDEDFNDSQIETGKEIIRHEREVREIKAHVASPPKPRSPRGHDTIINIPTSPTSRATLNSSYSSTPLLLQDESPPERPLYRSDNTTFKLFGSKKPYSPDSDRAALLADNRKKF